MRLAVARHANQVDVFTKHLISWCFGETSKRRTPARQSQNGTNCTSQRLHIDLASTLQRGRARETVGFSRRSGFSSTTAATNNANADRRAGSCCLQPTSGGYMNLTRNWLTGSCALTLI